MTSTPIQLCYGVFVQVLLRCALNPRVQHALNFSLFEILVGKDRLFIGNTTTSKYSNCTTGIGHEYVEAAQKLLESDLLAVLRDFQSTVISKLNPNKVILAALTLRDIIIKDTSIKDDTIVDRVYKISKGTLRANNSLEDPNKFLLGIFFYSIIMGKNREGKESLFKITQEYIDSFQPYDLPIEGSPKNMYRYQERCAQAVQKYELYKKKLLQAAANGTIEAMYFLGLNFFGGNFGFKQNGDEAFKWTKLAAESGYVPAQELLGSLYYHGIGVDQNFEEAFKWHKQAADNTEGYALACGQTAFMLKIGLGCEQDFDKAIEYYKKGIELGKTELYQALGIIYEENKRDLCQAVVCYKAAASFSAAACYKLGRLYCNGINGESNYREAGRWFRKAAEKAHTDAEHSLGDLYYWGKGFSRNFQKARYWYQKAAEKGKKESQYVLGYLNLHGLGGE